MDANEIMKPDAFQDISRQIIAANGDQGQITALLTQLQDGYTNLFATHTETSKNNEVLSQENTKLKEYNLELFMRQGQRMKEETQTGKTPEKTRAETITTADLFKEGK